MIKMKNNSLVIIVIGTVPEIVFAKKKQVSKKNILV